MIDFLFSENHHDHELFYSLDREVREMAFDHLMNILPSLKMDMLAGSITYKTNRLKADESLYREVSMPRYFRFQTKLGLGLELYCILDLDIYSEEYYCPLASFYSSTERSEHTVWMILRDNHIPMIWSGIVNTWTDESNIYNSFLKALKIHYIEYENTEDGD